MEEVKQIADDRIVASEAEMATAHTALAGSHAKVADSSARNASAQTVIAENSARHADALAKIAALDERPLPDHDVWLRVFLTRGGLANQTYAALEKAAAYADAALVEYRKRFQPPGPAV